MLFTHIFAFYLHLRTVCALLRTKKDTISVSFFCGAWMVCEASSFFFYKKFGSFICQKRESACKRGRWQMPRDSENPASPRVSIGFFVCGGGCSPFGLPLMLCIKIWFASPTKGVWVLAHKHLGVTLCYLQSLQHPKPKLWYISPKVYIISRRLHPLSQ